MHRFVKVFIINIGIIFYEIGSTTGWVVVGGPRAPVSLFDNSCTIVEVEVLLSSLNNA